MKECQFQPPGFGARAAGAVTVARNSRKQNSVAMKGISCVTTSLVHIDVG